MEDLEYGKAYYADIKRRAVAHGRSADDILIFPSIHPFLGESQAEAEEKYLNQSRFVDTDYAVKYLSRGMGIES